MPWTPPFALVVHTGRKSGRRYQTPVMVFRHDREYLIALTYGAGTDWVKNVVAAGGCELRLAGRRYPMTAPRVYADETQAGIRAFERRVLRLLGTTDFLSLTPADGGR